MSALGEIRNTRHVKKILRWDAVYFEAALVLELFMIFRAI